MTSINFLARLNKEAIAYAPKAQESLSRNDHMNDLNPGERLSQRHIEAVLVDFINSVGLSMGVDYAMYTSDLKPHTPTAIEQSLSNS